MTATELLPQLERDWQVIPSRSAELQERRRAVDARRKVTRGPRRESVEDALRSLLGNDFIELRTTSAAEANPWPSNPGSVGAFAGPGAAKKAFRLLDVVSVLNVAHTVGVELLGTTPPLAGESFTLDPDSRSPSIEKITLTAASSSSITATFTKPHSAGAIAVRPHPLWISNRRYSRIVIAATAARDPETRRLINELMARMLRGVSRWCVIQEGDFIADDPILGRADCTAPAA
jgi:hypothetical protein